MAKAAAASLGDVVASPGIREAISACLRAHPDLESVDKSPAAYRAMFVDITDKGKSFSVVFEADETLRRVLGLCDGVVIQHGTCCWRGGSAPVGALDDDSVLQFVLAFIRWCGRADSPIQDRFDGLARYYPPHGETRRCVPTVHLEVVGLPVPMLREPLKLEDFSGYDYLDFCTRAAQHFPASEEPSHKEIYLAIYEDGEDKAYVGIPVGGVTQQVARILEACNGYMRKGPDLLDAERKVLFETERGTEEEKKKEEKEKERRGDKYAFLFEFMDILLEFLAGEDLKSRLTSSGIKTTRGVCIVDYSENTPVNFYYDY